MFYIVGVLRLIFYKICNLRLSKFSRQGYRLVRGTAAGLTRIMFGNTTIWFGWYIKFGITFYVIFCKDNMYRKAINLLFVCLIRSASRPVQRNIVHYDCFCIWLPTVQSGNLQDQDFKIKSVS